MITKSDLIIQAKNENPDFSSAKLVRVLIEKYPDIFNHAFDNERRYCNTVLSRNKAKMVLQLEDGTPNVLGAKQPFPLEPFPQSFPLADIQRVPYMTEDDLLQQYSAECILDKFLTSIKKGLFLPEAELIQSLDLRTKPNFKEILRLPKYNSYRGVVSGTVYWGNKESITKMKNNHILI
jgi:hypothetical protein